VKLAVPRLATTYSIDTFKISEQDYLIGTPFSSSSDSSMAMRVFDKDNLNGFSDVS